MKIRVMGPVADCDAFVDALRTAPGLTITHSSRSYRVYGEPGQVRIYLDADYDPLTGSEGGAPQ